MSRYRIEFAPAVAMQLGALPKKIQRRVASRIDVLAENPRPQGCVKLRGSEDIWRFRVGEYRILYQVTDAEVLVLVLRVAHRKEVYKQQL
jgi:mRNA interferase RelE/StbE